MFCCQQLQYGGGRGCSVTALSCGHPRTLGLRTRRPGPTCHSSYVKRTRKQHENKAHVCYVTCADCRVTSRHVWRCSRVVRSPFTRLPGDVIAAPHTHSVLRSSQFLRRLSLNCQYRKVFTRNCPIETLRGPKCASHGVRFAKSSLGLSQFAPFRIHRPFDHELYIPQIVTESGWVVLKKLTKIKHMAPPRSFNFHSSAQFTLAACG